MGFLLIIFVIVVGIIFIMMKTEHKRLDGENKRLRKELYIAEERNSLLVAPLDTIAEQEPLTALKMLREHLENNK